MAATIPPPLTRREFAALLATVATSPWWGGCRADISSPSLPPGARPLPRPGSISSLTVLVARPGVARITPTLTADAWTLGGSVPSPTIRTRRGEAFGIHLENQLPQATTMHWHGMLVPPDADGHPRNAVQSGSTFHYSFPVVQRAGTFWYHPHAHHHTALQVHRGMAGFLIIGDEEEDALGLPGNEREILLMLQDRGNSLTDGFTYNPTHADMEHGMLRSRVSGNAVPDAAVALGPGPYRLRILNGSHARVYRIALGGGLPLTIIGNDCGLLPAPVTVPSAWLGVGERLDCIVDLTGLPPGGKVMLQSLGFATAGHGPSQNPQGIEMDLLELHRIDGVGTTALDLPATLSTILPLPPPVTTRSFAFSSAEGEAAHRISGRIFDMGRIDLQVPLGQCEDWTFQNDSWLPHPVHVHGCHFQIVSRTGGRNEVFGYERGWKDTALLMPGETVTVRIRFDAYPGLFLLHCHNLQHEDMGMMLNVEVTA